MMCSISQQTIDDILSAGKIFEVGGAVRDRMLDFKAPVKDRDYLVTGIPYESLSDILKKHGRVDLVGRSFGVIKFTQFRHDEQFTFDITLPRKEISTGDGHGDFLVDFDPSLPVEEDLKRRDFTINAMAKDLDSELLIDPLGGEVDLKNKQIRMISKESFKEDPLRIVRAVQFASRLEFEIEEKTLKALTENIELVKTVSLERISEELQKMLVLSKRPSVGLRLMQKTGLLDLLLPDLAACVGVDQPGGYHKYDVFEHTMHIIDEVQPILRLRLAAMFHDINKPQCKRIVEGGATFYSHEIHGSKTASRVLKHYRFPHETIDDVCTLVERHMFTTDVTDKGLRRLLRRIGDPLIFELLDLRRADVVAQGMGGITDDVDRFEADIRAEIDRKPPLSVSDLAIDGYRIMKMFKIKGGPVIGRILDHLMEMVLDDPSQNNELTLETSAREYYENEMQNEDIESNKESDQ